MGRCCIWAWLFIAASALLAGTQFIRGGALSSLPTDAYANDADIILSEAVEIWAVGVGSVAYLLALVVAAVLVLMWYLRSVRNAHELSHGVETTPAWVVWAFIVPLVSLWKPYSMTSELWRSSLEPDGWRGLNDPALLRWWWWAAVLIAGFVISIADALARSATSAGQLGAASVGLAAGYAIQIVGGLLFLRIGSAISKRQTALILAGRSRNEAVQPGWHA